MNCPVCNRNNAITLSICPSCGAMVDDSVREELKDKISPLPKPIVKPISFQKKPAAPEVKPITFEAKPFVPKTFAAPRASTAIAAAASIPKPEMPLPAPAPAPAPVKIVTADLAVKNTAPTLVEFHTTKATVPEWRLHLQNAVQQRQSRVIENGNGDSLNAPNAKLVTNGATALKTEIKPEPPRVMHKNPTVNSALQRIEQSRRLYMPEETQTIDPVFTDEPAGKNHPFHIAAKDGETLPAPRPAKINFTVKPKAATSLKTGEKEFDTNKLPPIPAKVSARFEKETELKIAETEEVFDEEIETEESDDLAPFAMRFNSGLFDLIIGAFLSLLLLTPFMIKSESWFTSGGLIAFAVTCAVVMFIYMTTSVALYGRTFGMRIFALEVVDIEGEEYPTIHQAAVSSCIYIFSLALGGIGFLTLPFNAEKRAVHDLVSGTIVVREI